MSGGGYQPTSLRVPLVGRPAHAEAGGHHDEQRLRTVEGDLAVQELRVSLWVSEHVGDDAKFFGRPDDRDLEVEADAASAAKSIIALYVYGRHKARRRREAVGRLGDSSKALDDDTVRRVLARWSGADHGELSPEHVALLYPPVPRV
jgi:hypothetical protein